ncbi:MAG: ribonuclease HI [Halothermotrichaceae bacterium]
MKFEKVGFIRTNYDQDDVPDQPLSQEEGHFLEIDDKYKNALEKLDRFKYIYVIFYLNKIDQKDFKLKLHKNNEEVGLFATRTPNRPNPVAISVVELIRIQDNKIYISGIDAVDGTPIIDIKPYIKELDMKNNANSGWIRKDNLLGNEILLYTDGACSGNPGPGGYAAVAIEGKNEVEVKGFEPSTTNNRMEMMAVLEGLKMINEGSKVKLISDSNYVLQGLKTWLKSWKAKGWKTSNNKAVKNKDLWLKLDSIIKKFDIEYVKVKGHSGNEYNELVDAMARKQIKVYKEKNP